MSMHAQIEWTLQTLRERGRDVRVSCVPLSAGGPPPQFNRRQRKKSPSPLGQRPAMATSFMGGVVYPVA